MCKEILQSFRSRGHKCHVPKTNDPGLMCTLILCVPLYGANEDSLPGYNNTMISSLWNCICLTLDVMVLSGKITREYADSLLKGRTGSGFELTTRKSDRTLSMTATSPMLLEARQTLLLSKSVPGNTSMDEPRVTGRSTTQVYSCLSVCILDALKVTPIIFSRPTKVECTHNQYPCVVLHDASISSVCLQCGMTGPCSILIDVGARYLCFEYEQSTCPERFMDLASELPSVVEMRLNDFMSYRQSPQPFCCSVQLDLKKSIVHCRKQIMWTRVDCPGVSYIISMVRPTLNFCTYRLLVADIVPGDPSASIMTLCFEMQKIRGFDKYQLRVQIDVSDPSYILMSGVLAHWYAARIAYRSIIVSCSLGSSVIQVHRISHRSVDRLSVSIDLIRVLVGPSGIREHCIVTHRKRKTVVKFPHPGDRDKGPSLTLGCNGGFQWIGNPMDISRTLAEFASLVEEAASRQEFIGCISRLSTIQGALYPSGISRAHDSEAT